MESSFSNLFILVELIYIEQAYEHGLGFCFKKIKMTYKRIQTINQPQVIVEVEETPR